MAERAEEGRLAWADALRVASIGAVVVLHAAAPLLTRYRTAGPGAWWAGNLWDSAVRWCVPVFVMLSGALLLGRDEPPGRFLAARLRRLAVPFLAWSAIYFYWDNFRDGRARPLSQLPARMLAEPVYYHLWFLYLVVALYLLVPVVSAFLRAAGPRGGWYLAGLWFVWASVLPAAQALSGRSLYFGPEAESSPLKFLGYLVLGHLLRDARAGPRHVPLLALGFLAGWALTALGTWHLTVVRGEGRFDGLLYEYYGANVVLMSVCVFLLGRSLPVPARLRRSALARRVLHAAGAATLGVYLVHALVLDVLRTAPRGLRPDAGALPAALGVPLFAAAVFGVSLAIVLLLRRVPLLRQAVP